jgi:hypothetical protein
MTSKNAMTIEAIRSQGNCLRSLLEKRESVFEKLVKTGRCCWLDSPVWNSLPRAYLHVRLAAANRMTSGLLSISLGAHCALRLITGLVCSKLTILGEKPKG